jgi:hypothetical protein
LNPIVSSTITSILVAIVLILCILRIRGQAKFQELADELFRSHDRFGILLSELTAVLAGNPEEETRKWRLTASFRREKHLRGVYFRQEDVSHPLHPVRLRRGQTIPHEVQDRKLRVKSASRSRGSIHPPAGDEYPVVEFPSSHHHKMEPAWEGGHERLLDYVA